MTAEPADSTAPNGEAAASADQADAAQRALKEALTAAERGLTEAAKTAERVIREGIQTLREQSQGSNVEPAKAMADEVQTYLVERVKERPVTATLAGVGVGLLIGLLLASRGK